MPSIADLGQRAADLDAGMVVQDVDPTVLVQRSGNELLDRRVIADIGRDRLGATTDSVDVAGRCFAGYLVPVGDHHHRPFPGHDHGAGAADAGPCACHHGDAIFQNHDPSLSAMVFVGAIAIGQAPQAEPRRQARSSRWR